MLVDSVRQPCASAGIRCQARHDRQSQLANDSDAESSHPRKCKIIGVESIAARLVVQWRITANTTQNNQSHTMSIVL